jgi:eukaryotic-like serine/threonine-protein kinase
VGSSSSDSFGSDLLPFARAPAHELPRDLLPSRYAVVRRIGEGSFGTVYAARDLEADRLVALKLLRRATPEWLYRFKREFRSLAGVRHPNLVRLEELSADGEQAFFTMELIAGATLDRHVREHRHDIAATYRQLADGVRVLHRAGLLHRDIKPSNVMVEEGGRVVLLDFGLAVPRDGFTTQLAGTPAYMAPELWNDVPASEASDWFSVGAMLYESLTGFSWSDSGKTRVTSTELAPSGAPVQGEPAALLAPGEPALATLCDALLSAEPSRRPTGDEVLAQLGGMPAAACLEGPTSEHFVGRRAELDALHDVLEGTRRGQAIALVEGPAGSGKSALLGRFADEVAARIPGALVLRGACHERESVPYKALDGVIDELSRALSRMPRADVERCMPRSTAALGRAFPVLRQVEAVRRFEDGWHPPAEELRRRGGEALRELFVRVGDQRRLVLIVDDVHWGDADSAALLGQLLHGPDGPPLTFVASASREQVGSGFLREIQRQRTALLAGVAQHHIALHGLGDAEADSMVRRMLPAADAETRARLVRDAGGDASFLAAMVRHGAGARGIDAALSQRVEALPAPVRACLEAIAVEGRALPLRVLRALTSSSGDLDNWLASLERDHLARRRATEGDASFECCHARIGSAVLRAIAPEERRRIHAALAAAFAELCPEDAERVAHHFAEAGDPRRAYGELLRAAEAAARTGANELAATLLERALSLLSPAERRSALGSDAYARLARVLSMSGFGKRAAEASLLAAAHAAPDRARELRAMAAQELLAGGYIDEGTRLFYQVTRDLGMRLPESRAGTVARLAVLELERRRYGYRYELREERAVPALELQRIDALYAGAVGVWGVSPLLAALVQAELLSRALAAGEPRRLLDALLYHVMMLGFAGSPAAHEGLRALDDLATRCPGDRATFCRRVGEAVMFHVDTRWRDVAELTSPEAMGYGVGDAGVTSMRQVMRIELLPFNAHFWMGRVALAARGLPAVLELTRDRGDRMGHMWMSLIHSWVLCAHDRPEQAREVIERARRDWPAGLDTLQEVWAHNHLHDIARYTDDREGLAESALWSVGSLVMRTVARFNRDGTTQLFIKRALHSLAIARHTPRRRRRSLMVEAEAAVEKVEGVRLPYGLAWSLALRGAIAWFRGDRGAAAQHLSDAEMLLDGVGMHQVLAAVRRALARIGVGARVEALVQKSEAYFRDEGVVDPKRFSRLYLPLPLEDE